MAVETLPVTFEDVATRRACAPVAPHAGADLVDL
jgi:hypothetical protein